MHFNIGVYGFSQYPYHPPLLRFICHMMKVSPREPPANDKRMHLHLFCRHLFTRFICGCGHQNSTQTLRQDKVNPATSHTINRPLRLSIMRTLLGNQFCSYIKYVTCARSYECNVASHIYHKYIGNILVTASTAG